MKTFFRYLKDQKGIETLEWILIGALIVAVGIAVYPGTLKPALQSSISTVGATIVGQASS
jgi:Flp pilus assembly pilin Flp